MAGKTAAKKSSGVGERLINIERLVRTGFRQTDRQFRGIDKRFDKVDKRFGQIDRRLEQVDKRFGHVDEQLERGDRRFSGIEIGLGELKREMNDRFGRVEESISQLATHVDGFMKLHETLDIEVRVMKEQMNRF